MPSSSIASCAGSIAVDAPEATFDRTESGLRLLEQRLRSTVHGPPGTPREDRKRRL
jgi:hypothetical protein